MTVRNSHSAAETSSPVKPPTAWQAPRKRGSVKLAGLIACWLAHLSATTGLAQTDRLTSQQWAAIEALENQRIQAIESVVGSVIAIYGETLQGGGSGVIIDPTGIALTNHHVIMGAGVSGMGGLADGKLYHWTLIGTDPGGDVSVIQLAGKDRFPFTPLGDSNLVQIGDWALAMGNPFVLTEDQFPTVTLGIVSGIKRYQPGAGANQLVYGNCIQVDSSINPGNSGGPLFNLQGKVIGINGRGSFKDRGRVNVGLGYAISANQIKNFFPDLLATKLIEHGTLDASFTDRQGKVICSTINQQSPVAAAGLKLGDELLEFEGEVIRSANQFTNLICTLPVDWPAHLKIRKPDQTVVEIHVRLLGLPYPKPGPTGGREEPRPNPDQPREEDEQIKQQQQMLKLLSAPANRIRDLSVNQRYAKWLIKNWQAQTDQTAEIRDTEPTNLAETTDDHPVSGLRIVDDLRSGGQVIGSQTLHLATDGRIRIDWKQDGIESTYWFDGESFFAKTGSNQLQNLTLVESKLAMPLVQAMGILATNQRKPFAVWGDYRIDGGDKSLGRVAYRVAQLDADSDPFYFWLSYEDDLGQARPFLLKASPEKDCQSAGGVVFDGWQATQKAAGNENSSWFVPQKRAFVKGLSEVHILEIVNRETVWQRDLNGALFSPTE